MRPMIAFMLAMVLLLAMPQARAHPGGVAGDGCHTEAKTQERHCHPEHARSLDLYTCDLSRAPQAGEEGVFYGPVIRVADGDTLEVKVQGVVMDFRLAEVDAPEMDQRYGTKAREELAALVAGKSIVLVPSDTDRYGRTVAYAWAGAVCVNAELVRRGAAYFYSEYSASDFLYGIEQRARNGKLGLWALPLKDRVEPWLWRRERYR